MAGRIDDDIMTAEYDGRVIATAALRRPAADAGCTKESSGATTISVTARLLRLTTRHVGGGLQNARSATEDAQVRPRASTAYASVGAAAPVVPAADGQARHSRHP